MTDLPAPHGGRLCELLAPRERADQLRLDAASLPAWDLTERQRCDLELLLNGGFSPLAGFLGRADYESVLRDMRLADGTLWRMPITLVVSEAFAAQLSPGTRIVLRDTDNTPLAILTVGDIWQPDRVAEAQAVFGSTDRAHPA